ncbi:hypothetical protein P171DRAFT_469742 [Karstenula rhodostoma CBS 690.94]|uniref:Uncharacterized protein n=1 Tax=Karstenula rhodostoma CBS 690.94 TaxID=1392251 RepID=A0A9P4PSW5_9PLEO|nr:hypothetical protein P171DRAFT_469742 [Karstenula rhodostoma CBS 690.94]
MQGMHPQQRARGIKHTATHEPRQTVAHATECFFTSSDVAILKSYRSQVRLWVTVARLEVHDQALLNRNHSDRLACAKVRDGAVHVRYVPRAVDAGYDPEGRQDRSRGGLVAASEGGLLIGDVVDERLEAEDVTEKLAFVAAIVKQAAGFVELRKSTPCRRVLDQARGELAHARGGSGTDRAMTACVKCGLDLCAAPSGTVSFCAVAAASSVCCCCEG